MQTHQESFAANAKSIPEDLGADYVQDVPHHAVQTNARWESALPAIVGTPSGRAAGAGFALGISEHDVKVDNVYWGKHK